MRYALRTLTGSILMSKRWLILVVIVTYLLMLVGGAALKPGYSHISQYISELNATGTAFAQTIGWLGFIPFGLGSVLLLITVRPHAPVSGASAVGYWLLLAEPIAYIGSAFAPCDIGCPSEGSISQNLHNLLGLCTYLSTTLGLVLLSFTPNLNKSTRFFWLFLAVTWFTLFGLMLDESLSGQRGILQRLAEWIVYSGLLFSAWKLLGNAQFKKN